ncbi:MAG: hypothetical protein PHN69_05000 [Candidatus Pacebacteria bacterium]|nr:hypothetical protein [Candidatus Paceibacterota bacterium]
MFRKLTKWKVYAMYNYGLNDYIVMFRRNERSGMLYFKTKKIANTTSSRIFTEDVVFKSEIFKNENN